MPLTIKDSVIVTGSNLIKNDYYIDYYKKKGQDVEHFLVDVLGRNERYHCSKFENTLTLAADATDKILKKNNLKGSDIDLIVCCSQYPEFTVPSQACILHNHIKGKEKCITFDLNVNCLGMVRGLNIINRYFNDKKGDLKYALLIGADFMSIHSTADDIVTYSSFSDGACATLLKYTDKDNMGVIGSSDRTISTDAYGCLFPECGMSNISTYIGDYVKTTWTTPYIPAIVSKMKESLDDVLIKHSIKMSEIDWYCGSQFSLALFNQMVDACELPKEKAIYVGDKYGYTGTSSPFFAYTQAITDGKIKHGDLVFFSTVGIGHTVSSMLVRV